MNGKWCCLLLLLLLAGTSPLFAQRDSTLVDSSEFYIVRKVFIDGNKVTKDNIILRELTFHEGDTIFAANLQQETTRSANNLLNTSLFNFATINKMELITNNPSDTVYADFMISVAERWYTWPVPIFELVDPNFNTWWLTRDFSRTNWGAYVYRQNFRGRNETLALIAQFGYTKQFGFSYRIPYINKAQTLGIGMSSVYQQTREITHATEDNKRLLFSLPDQNIRSEMFNKLSFTYKKGLYTNQTLEIRHNYAEIDDTITTFAPDYFTTGSTSTSHITLTYTLEHEKRDVKAYPLKGYYLKALLAQNGLGLLRNNGPNYLYTILTAKKYFKLSEKFYLAGSAKAKISAKTRFPYYFQEMLGYADYVRGYEYYIVDGQNFALLKTNFKFRLFGPKVLTLDFVPSEKFNTFHYAFYLNLFADAGYVDDAVFNQQNQLANDWLFGTGIGLDFVTYYDKVMRIEYSFNRLGESGIFLHFTKPI